MAGGEESRDRDWKDQGEEGSKGEKEVKRVRVVEQRAEGRSGEEWSGMEGRRAEGGQEGRIIRGTVQITASHIGCGRLNV